MFVSSNLGTVECTTFSDYQAYIKRCIEHNSGNEIWCSCDGKPQSHPCLSILVKGKETVVNYFSESNSEMFASLGDVSRDGTVEFENGQYDIVAYQIIDAKKAMECALQFFCNQGKPSCIKWQEL